MATEEIQPVRDIDYYIAEPSLVPPTFEGKGAELLGIRGQAVTPQLANQLFDGLSPEGVRLPKYLHPQRRGAFEITINLPKCGSVLDRLAGDDRIKELLEQAAHEAARHIQKEACVRVRRKLTWGQERKPDNLVYMVFMHPSSRAGDPHLHAHVVFYNLSLDRQEKSWKALETGYIDQKKMGKLTHNTLVKGLRQLGYKVKDTGKEFEIVGVPAEVKAVFSRRHEQIKEMEREFDEKAARAGNRGMSSKERGKLSLYRRPEKAAGVSPEARHASWLGRITPPQLDGLRALVERAKAAVRHFRFRQGVTRNLDIMRQKAMMLAETAQEKGHGNER